MKKLLSMGIVLSLLLALLTSCQSPGPDQDLGDKFIFEEDNQYYYRMSRILASPMVESEESIYIVKDGYIYSKNKKTGEIVPLCNKPDCMHDDSEFNDNGSSNCNAYVGVAWALDYYHNKLYFMTAFSELYEMDKSGTTRTKLMQLKEDPFAAMLHRGYLYLSFTSSDGLPDEYTEEEKKSYPIGWTGTGSTNGMEIRKRYTKKKVHMARSMSCLPMEIRFICRLLLLPENMVQLSMIFWRKPLPSIRKYGGMLHRLTENCCIMCRRMFLKPED